MKYICPKCGTLQFNSGPLDDKGKVMGVDRDIHFVHREKGPFYECTNKNCSEKFPVFHTSRKGLTSFHIKGLIKEPQGD